MKKNIRGIRKIENKVRYSKEEKIEKVEQNSEVINKEEENDKSKFRLVTQGKTKNKRKEIKQKEEPKIQENRECFQLVIIENIPWYKRAVKAIVKFFGKQILVKSGR